MLKLRGFVHSVRWQYGIGFLLSAMLGWSWLVAANSAGAKGEWPAYGGDNRAAKYSALDQINQSNINKLRVAWRWESPDGAILKQHADLQPSEFQATPIMIGGVLYTSTAMSQVAAIDAATGKTLWVYDPETWRVKWPTTKGFQHRGVAYWRDGRQERIFIATGDSRLIALDAGTGKPIPQFGDSSEINLRTAGLYRAAKGSADLYGHTSPPLVCRDVVIVGSYIKDRSNTREMPPGDVRGFDASTGKLLWTFHTVPQKGEFGNETWPNDSWKYTGNANVWAPMSADDELGYVYMPVSTPTNNFFGGQRPGDGLFGDSLVCLEAKTGKRVWHFQTVHHGIWDYDPPAAPNLLDINVAGRRVKAVAQVTKQGFCYVFDRVTGKPVWPIVERPVPPSQLPDEKTAPTQPFPTRPLPFDRHYIMIEMLNGADLLLLDRWYITYHAPETLQRTQRRQTKYATFRTYTLPLEEAKAMNMWQGRMTEIGFASLAEFNKGWVNIEEERKKLTLPAAELRGGFRSETVTIHLKPDNVFVDHPTPPKENPYFRWIFFYAYPEGVSPEAGEKWFHEVFAKELAARPGVKRFVRYRSVRGGSPAGAGASQKWSQVALTDKC